ncbi:MAG: hypothetical protein ACYDH6_06220 [Acidimicrobiales bacterium]
MNRRIVIPLVLIAAGCGGGGHSSSVSTGPGAGSSTTGGSALSTDTGAPSTTAGAHGSGPTTTPPANHPAPSGTLPPGTKPAAPAAPGTYRYHQSGTTTLGSTTKPVPAEGSVLIDPVTSAGTQTSHRTVDSSQPPSDTVFSFQNGGVFITQLVMRSKIGSQTQTFTCTFTTPLPTPPWPPTVGAAYQGHADCGSFTIDVHGSVTGTKDVNVGGTTHRSFVLASSIVLHGQLEGTGSQNDWVDPATSLLLHEDASQRATYGGFVKLASSTSSDLESLHPS